MSIKLEFFNDNFRLLKLKLPTRYYYFNYNENYIKFLSIGEGIFPEDKLQTKISLRDSNAIFTTESATKVYPSSDKFGINSIDITLKNSNCEFINDELILYENSKLIQFLKIKVDKESTFFYVDILSSGRSFESFDFASMKMRNRFIIDLKLEYFENFEVNGNEIKEYFNRHDIEKMIFSKVYIKTKNNDDFLNTLSSKGYTSFSYTKSKKMLIGVVSGANMSKMKQKIDKVWELYRESLNKKEFNLGKQ